LSSSRDFFLKREDSQAVAYSQSMYSSRSSDERDVQQRDVWQSPESVKVTFYGGVSDIVIANSSSVLLGKAVGSDLVGGSHFQLSERWVQEGWGSWLRMSKQKRQEFKYFSQQCESKGRSNHADHDQLVELNL